MATSKLPRLTPRVGECAVVARLRRLSRSPYAVAIPLPLPKGRAMRDVTSCADNLILLGETLEVAAEYINRCEETLGHEDAFMVGLAHDQLYFLRKAPGQTGTPARRPGIAIASSAAGFRKKISRSPSRSRSAH